MEENRKSMYNPSTNPIDTSSTATMPSTTAPQSGTSSMGKSFAESSPEEIRQMMKEKVSKGVAAIAGALEGFNKEVEQNDLPGQVRHGIQGAGDTARSAISSTTEEVEGLKQPLKDAGKTLGSTARDIGKTAKEEADKTRQTVKGGSSSGGSKQQPEVDILAVEETTIITDEDRLNRGNL